jgi:hypothetical protein
LEVVGPLDPHCEICKILGKKRERESGERRIRIIPSSKKY